MPLDGAYITFRYALNLSQGAGYVYNPGERVQGTTTPVFTLILAGMAALFGAEHLPVLSFGIAIAADILNVWLFYRIARRVLQSNGLAFAAALVSCSSRCASMWLPAGWKRPCSSCLFWPCTTAVWRGA